MLNIITTYTVTNAYDVEIDIDVARNLMDDDIIIYEVEPQCPETDQEFFDLYCNAYRRLTGQECELNKPNPVY